MLSFGTAYDRMLAKSAAPVVFDENTTDEKIVAIVPIRGNLMGLNGVLRGELFISNGASNNNLKTYNVYFGNVTGSVLGAPTKGNAGTYIQLGTSGAGITQTNSTISCSLGFFIANRNSLAVNCGGFMATRSTAASTAIQTGTIDTSASQNVVVTITKGVNTDDMTLEYFRLAL